MVLVLEVVSHTSQRHWTLPRSVANNLHSLVIHSARKQISRKWEQECFPSGTLFGLALRSEGRWYTRCGDGEGLHGNYPLLCCGKATLPEELPEGAAAMPGLSEHRGLDERVHFRPACWSGPVRARIIARPHTVAALALLGAAGILLLLTFVFAAASGALEVRQRQDRGCLLATFGIFGAWCWR